MSTEIAKLDAINGCVELVQFFGGKKLGLCLQLGYRVPQFTKKQVQELVKELQNWLGETELPFYTKTRPSEQINPKGNLTEVFGDDY